MKCLSVRQPWAWLIIHGGKDVENRAWRTRYSGPLLIHAAKVMEESDYYEGKATQRCIPDRPLLPPRDELVYGAIIGHVRLEACRQTPIYNNPWAIFGCWNWILKCPESIGPIPYQGRRGCSMCRMRCGPEVMGVPHE